METLVKGNIIVLNFPFSDLSTTKKRPALVVATPYNDEAILCQITSRQTSDKYSEKIVDKDFFTGNLNLTSTIRINKLFTADESIILYKAGALNPEKLKLIIEKICKMFKT